MQIEWLGERALILRNLEVPAFTVARHLQVSCDLPEFQEAVASYDTVGLYFTSKPPPLPEVEAIIRAAVLHVPADELGPLHAIPVCYELNEDLGNCAAQLQLTAEQVIERHLSREYLCYAVGFSPGFAYLGHLDPTIRGLKRLPSPRKSVPPGSVGITGSQTAVYPAATPGGWNLIGRCPLELADVAEDYFPIHAGDRVQFQRIDESEFRKLEGSRL